jgi:hypothetical protein
MRFHFVEKLETHRKMRRLFGGHNQVHTHPGDIFDYLLPLGCHATFSEGRSGAQRRAGMR